MGYYFKDGRHIIKFMVKGRNVIRTTFRSREEAELWEKQARYDLSIGKEVDAGLPEIGSKSGPVPRNIGPFVDHTKRVHWDYHGRKSSAKLHRNAEMFAHFVGPDVPVTEALSESNISAYLLYMKEERRNSNDTINRHIASIKVLTKVAKAERLIAARPEVSMMKKAESRDRVLTQKEEAALLAYLVQMERKKEHDLTVFLLDVGSRIGETLLLQWVWVDFDEGIITFPGQITKSGKTRKVFMTDRVRAMLLARSRVPDAEDTVFWDINYWGFGNFWRKMRTRLKFMHDVRIHDLRHTCATRLAAGGANASMIQQWLGHESITTSQRYINLQVDHLQSARDVLNRYGMVAPAGLEPARP